MVDRDLYYRAYSAAYGKERDHRLVTELIDVAFVVVGVFGASQEWKGPELVAAALLWLAIREAPWFVRPGYYRCLAARIQDDFDASFGMPPNVILTGKPVPDHEIRKLADGSTASFDPGYFIDTSGLDQRIALICMQHQTLTWGEADHRRYSIVNYVLAFIALTALFAWFFISDVSMRDAVVLLAPVTPFIVGRVQLGRQHRDHSEARREVREAAEEALDAVTVDEASYPPMALVRSIQDRLFQERSAEGRIPFWLYWLGVKKHRRTIDVSCEQRVRRLRKLGQDSPTKT